MEYMPKGLENMIKTLFEDNSLQSWSINGKGNQTQLIIRFDMAGHKPHASNINYKFKRAKPSQLARDKQRAEDNQNKQLKSTLDECKDMNLDTISQENMDNDVLSSASSETPICQAIDPTTSSNNIGDQIMENIASMLVR